MVADVLSRSISHASQDGLIRCLKMARNYPIVSHIFFADDSLLFLHSNEGVAANIFNLLEEYSNVSGQQSTTIILLFNLALILILILTKELLTF